MFGEKKQTLVILCYFNMFIKQRIENMLNIHHIHLHMPEFSCEMTVCLLTCQLVCLVLLIN